MAHRLPLLISIPHSGERVPTEIADIVGLTNRDIFFDGDPLTNEIYDFRDDVEVLITTSIARACVDLNRAPSDRPPKNPDGVVKVMTTDGTPVYREGGFPGNRVIETLLRKYYHPYHETIRRSLNEGNLKLALDCHSMLAVAPPIEKDAGAPRPLICLSNGGDEYGLSTAESEYVTCPPEWIKALSDGFRDEFGGEGKVSINNPFTGGYISRLYAQNRDVPWMQLEINRVLYLAEPYFDEGRLKVAPERLRELNGRIIRVIRRFMTELGNGCWR